MLNRFASLALLLGWMPMICHGADPFNAEASVGASTVEVGYTTAEDAFDSLKGINLSDLLPYSGVEVVSTNIDFRGLELLAGYPVLSSPQLDLDIPTLGITRSFVGATRDESLEMLKDFFKNGDVLSRIMRELARVSPVDPIAGNPASLQSRMVFSVFDRSFRARVRMHAARTVGADARVALDGPRWTVAAAGESLSGMGAADPGIAAVANAVAGVELSRYRQAGLTTVGVAVPLSYSFGAEPDRPWALDGSLFYSDTEGAKTYSVDVGIGYDHRVNDGWYLVPALHYGVTASEDLGSLGQMMSVALTSAALLHERGRTTLWMGNTINVLRSLNASIGDYSFDPELHNVAFVNGLVLATPLERLGSNYWIEYSVTDTRYTGSDLYDERYDELGIAIARSNTAGGYLRAGVSYLDTTNSKGWRVSLQYAF